MRVSQNESIARDEEAGSLGGLVRVLLLRLWTWNGGRVGTRRLADGSRGAVNIYGEWAGEGRSALTIATRKLALRRVQREPRRHCDSSTA